MHVIKMPGSTFALTEILELNIQISILCVWNGRPNQMSRAHHDAQQDHHGHCNRLCYHRHRCNVRNKTIDKRTNLSKSQKEAKKAEKVSTLQSR